MSALATKLLAASDNNGSNPLVCAILGSGPQAESHAVAMAAVRRISRFVLWSRTAENAVQLKTKISSLGLNSEVEVANTVESALKSADIICVVTGAHEPILKREWIKPGAHINAVGAHSAKTRELDSQTMKDAKVYADKRESLFSEGGDFLIPLQEGLFDQSHLLAELSELVVAPHVPSRSPQDITVFKSLGLAVEDIACAKFIFDRCRANKSGSWKAMLS